MFTSVPVTVGEVLGLEPLVRAGPRVLAGENHLGRPVRWVHVVELPDVAHLLEGGELLLTTGFVIAGDAEAQRRYVKELAEAGAAGLVIELGRTFDAIPAGMVQAARAQHLPLVALDRETRFVEVTEVVHREILNRQYALLDRAERVSRELAEHILGGADVAKLVSELGKILGAVVVFEDRARRVVAMSGPGGSDTDGSLWERHARLSHDNQREALGNGAIQRVTGSRRDPGCSWVDIWIRHERWGRLHVLEGVPGATAVAGPDDLLVDRAGAAIALSMLSEKDAAHLAERAGDALIAEIAAGRRQPVSEILRRARNLGADLATGRLVAAVLEVGAAPGLPDQTDEDRLESLHGLTNAMRAMVLAKGCSALVGESGDRVVAIVAIPGSRPISVVLDEIVTAATAQVVRRHDVQVIAGTSGEVGVGVLDRAIEEATVASGFGRNSTSGRLVHHFAELGAYQLLARLADGPELERFVDAELRVLLERDRKTRPRLVATLRAYLRHAGRKAEAARELGIQRRTLYQRVERIESLLGRSLDDQATRTQLTLAIQGLDFLARRKPSSSTAF